MDLRWSYNVWVIEEDLREPEYDDAYVLEHCYTPEGVDRSLILVALAMTVDERLERLRIFGAGMLELRGAYASTQRG